MEHETWCPVADDTVGPLLARYWQAHEPRLASEG
jgi:hypothetical protein